MYILASAASGAIVWVIYYLFRRVRPRTVVLPPEPDPKPDRLLELRSWLDSGVITKDEYTALCDGVLDGR